MTQEKARHFTFSGDYLILRTIRRYNPTDSGKGWKSKPSEIDRAVIDNRQYVNYVTAVPWFNNYGDGAYCRAHEHYTEAGYLPSEIISVGPFHCKKVVATFEFIPRRALIKTAGYREKDILSRAVDFELFPCPPERGEAYTLITGDGARATFQTNGYIWIN